jgi:hypothetical protein
MRVFGWLLAGLIACLLFTGCPADEQSPGGGEQTSEDGNAMGR